MGQEYFINNQTLEDKIRQLLPSQGGAGAGFDLSASTQIIPIIDVTESAEGSNLRQDLQSSFSLSSATHTSTSNATATIISNTGYYRILGTIYGDGAGTCDISITDGITTKILLKFFFSTSNRTNEIFDFNVFLPAGVSVTQNSSVAQLVINTTTRQLADIDGVLVNP